MIKLSLENEPPKKFGGKKEVMSKEKESEALPQLIFFLKNTKNKNKSVNARKNLEEQLKSDWQKYFFDAEYLKTNNNFFEENTTATAKIIEFTNVLDTNQNKITRDFHYGQKNSDTEFTEKKVSGFYEMSYSYYFTPQTKEENKKVDSYDKSKEQEPEEIPYIMYNFEEKAEQENLK